ncbi:PE family protein [Mycobacterium sp.]|uniref:PE family protein n=1 Tax=Mycobacterium sp. TaxID=1785 RepID=UPI003C7295B8
MSYMTAQPDLIAAAAADLGQIRSALGAANAAAAAPTSGLAAAAGDEVSAAAATLFNSYAQEYQALVGEFSAFHEQFAQTLAAAGNAYVAAEAANVGAMSAASRALNSITAPIQSLLGGGAAASPAAAVTLVMGASGLPIPFPLYIDQVTQLFIQPFYTVGNVMGLNTPEGLYPLTGVKDLTFDVSAARGVTILDQAIKAAFATGANPVNVFGYSQSAVVASMEMAALNPSNTPGGSLLGAGQVLNFSLVGDVSNPNGGLLPRFPGLKLPSIGLTLFGTATPDNSFPTQIHTIEYDGFADFPQYPLNVVSDVNAFLGIIELHGQYPDYGINPDLGTAIELTNTVGTPLTHYYIIPSAHVPLVSPIRAIPVIGTPLADLIEPDVRVIVDLGYGSTTQGWSPDPPNVPTGFGVIPPVSPAQVLSALNTGTQQGISAFQHDISTMLSSPPSAAGLTAALSSAGTGADQIAAGLSAAVSSPASFIGAIQDVNTRVVNAVTGSTAAAYSVALPTADIANALAISLPSYDINVFLDGIERMADGDPVGGLVYALGGPFAADTAALTLFGGFEIRVIQQAIQQIGDAIAGAPLPPLPGQEVLIGSTL